MPEYIVRVMRRRIPLVGSRMKIQKLEHDTVSVHADSEDSALDQVLKAEYAEGGRRLRVYVEIERPDGGSRGLGDYALMDVREEERLAEQAKEHGSPSE